MNLKETLNKHHFKFKKKYGQNFITDPGLLSKIVSTAEITQQDVVVEIGPGAGTLTKAIAQKARAIIAVEIDQDLIPILNESLGEYDNFYLIHADALQVNLDELVAKTIGEPCRYKVVANLPYYITTPLVMHFLEQDFAIDRIVIMVQKEVAERFQAQPGKKAYGSITVALNYYGQIDMAFIVPRHLFMPQPDVDSAVVDIKLWSQKPFEANNPELFRRLVKAAFNQRRKTLNNALKTANIDQDILSACLDQCHIDPKRRGETLSVEEYVNLANALDTMLSNQ